MTAVGQRGGVRTRSTLIEKRAASAQQPRLANGAAARVSFYEDESLQAMQLAALLRRGFREAQVLMARSLSENQLSELQYHLLLEAGAAGADGIMQARLPDLLKCTMTRVSLLLRELSERGLVTALRTPPDRRVVKIGVTAEGCRQVNRALQAQREALNAFSSGLDLPSAAALLEAALNLYLGADVSIQPREPRS
jgi:DNA-binding MarR family transcriptional regulator